jgi:hypothetical protein
MYHLIWFLLLKFQKIQLIRNFQRILMFQYYRMNLLILNYPMFPSFHRILNFQKNLMFQYYRMNPMNPMNLCFH